MASRRSLGVSRTVLRKKFHAGMTFRNYRDKEIVFSQGDSADSVFYVESGTVKLTVVRTLRRDPQFATAFVEYLLSRVVRFEEDLIDQFFNFSERRLARVLLLFGEITKESKSDSP